MRDAAHQPWPPSSFLVHCTFKGHNRLMNNSGLRLLSTIADASEAEGVGVIAQ